MFANSIPATFAISPDGGVESTTPCHGEPSADSSSVSGSMPEPTTTRAHGEPSALCCKDNMSSFEIKAQVVVQVRPPDAVAPQVLPVLPALP